MEIFSRPHIRLSFAAGSLPGFTLLLQSGFVARTCDCGSIKAFLVDTMGLAPEFIESVIQSVFLDGRPVDDLDSANIREGSTLALSAAMPGLVGATMRRGGYYAPLRSGISHASDECQQGLFRGDVTVKLFNLVASELGPALLERGILVRGGNFEEFLATRPSEFWSACRSITVDGREADARELRESRWGDQLVLFSVESAPPEE
jgi:hypothetical protein